ncbi:KH domain-containing protein [Striga hermonthica]|uniref:KH domain-containing protein n=1 Tax=Striga hermonthica TaxID=68872 RepID=A0A9N7MM69_STRHE|nr:KH domain-containing protein [Striga hermonthica]
MADEKLIASPENGPAAPAATLTSDSTAADGHKRKLGDLELSNVAEPVSKSENNANPDTLNNEAQEEEGKGGEDESESKRRRLESNGDNVTEAEADGLVSGNGHQEEEKKDETEKVEPVQPESADANVEHVENQEPHKEHIDQEPPGAPLETVTQEPTSHENEKTELSSLDELGKPNAENDEPSELPREGDVPVYSAERQSGSGRQILSRKMEVPNDKVGVLIGKAGETICSLQDNSGAKIQIMRDADADPRSTTRPVEVVGTLEDINKAEKLIKDVIAEANAGGSPSLVARGFNTAKAASSGEQVEIQVPIEKVGLIIGKGGETIRNLQTRSGARILLIQQNLSDGEQPKERTVRFTGNKWQIDTAREMIKDVMNQTVRSSPLSGGYSQQGYRPPRGPAAPQWGPRGSHHAQCSGYDFSQRGTYPSQNSQYPPSSYGNYPPQQPPRGNFGPPSWEQRPPASMHGPSPQGNYNYGQQPGPEYGHPSSYSQPPPQPYNHGYNEAKYGNHGPPQHYGPQPTPYSQGGVQSGYGPPYDQHGKPPMYSMQQQPPQVPHSQPYGQPRPNQPGEAPYQGTSSSAQPYGQNMPPQQPYPYPSSGPTQQTYPPPYGSAPTSEGYGHPPATAQSGSGYGQPIAYGQAGPQQQQPPPAAYSQAGPTGGYSSYPVPQPGGYAEQPAPAAAGYGYQQVQPDPATYGAPQGPAAGYPTTGVGQAGGYAQPAQAQAQAQAQTGYDQSGGYANVPAQVPAGVSPQAGYAQQYDASQIYGGGHR